MRSLFTVEETEASLGAKASLFSFFECNFCTALHGIYFIARDTSYKIK